MDQTPVDGHMVLLQDFRQIPMVIQGFLPDADDTPAPDATVRPPSQNTPQQFKQAVEGALATPRPAKHER